MSHETTTPSTAVTVYDGITDPMQFIREIGKSIAVSGMFGCSSIDQGNVLALECATQKCTPLTLARRFDIIQGKLSMKADAMLGAFNNAGGMHEILEYSPEACEVAFKLGKQKPLTIRITWEDAKGEKWPYKADGKTLKDNWSTPIGRQDMLWARVVSRGVRKLKPEIVAGYYTPEEVRDFIDVQMVPPAAAAEPVDVEALMQQAAGASSGPVIEVTSKTGEPVTVTHETPMAEPAAASIAVPDAPSSTAPPQSAGFDPQQQTTLERISPAGLQMLQGHVANAIKAGMPKDQARQRIEHYAGGEGRKMADLTPAAAVELQKELTAFIRGQQQPTGAGGQPAESVAGIPGSSVTPPAPATAAETPKAPPATEAGTNGHITPTQVQQIRTIVADLAKVDSTISAKVDAIVRGGGKSRLEDLSKEAGAMLLEKLYIKARMYEESKRRKSEATPATEAAGATAGN